MEEKEDSNIPAAKVEDYSTDDEYENLLQTLEQQTNWDGHLLLKYQGFWYPKLLLRPILSCMKHFIAHDGDIILVTIPKSGTTWLKALTFSIVNRNVNTIDQHPLLVSNPHDLVPFLEITTYGEPENPDNGSIPYPRMFSTHIPFKALPRSIHKANCKFIYLSRNPLDQFISERHFLVENKLEKDGVPRGMVEAFEKFCQGIQGYGPFWDHMLGYWNAHLKNPKEVLFLKYEDMKGDITSNVKKIAEFLGCPFSVEEEKQGLIDQISSLCSFEKLRNLEVNKSGNREIVNVRMSNSSFFRKGEVGDWTNYLTPTMAEQMKKIVATKLEGSGLTFNTFN